MSQNLLAQIFLSQNFLSQNFLSQNFVPKIFWLKFFWFKIFWLKFFWFKIFRLKFFWFKIFFRAKFVFLKLKMAVAEGHNWGPTAPKPSAGARKKSVLSVHYNGYYPRLPIPSPPHPPPGLIERPPLSLQGNTGSHTLHTLTGNIQN